MKYDLLIENVKAISMDNKFSTYKWIGIKDGIITGLGTESTNAECKKLFDGNGATVLPGLTDCHVHVVNTGINLKGVSLEACSTIAEVLGTLEKECKERKGANSWVYGVNYVPQNIKEKRYPTRWELDGISGEQNVAIFAATLHGCAVNTNAYNKAKVPENYPGVQKSNGKPNGVYSSDESAFCAISNMLGSLNDDELWDLIKTCIENAKHKGCTAIHGLFGQFVKEDRDLKLILERKAELDIDVTVFYQTWDVDKVLDLGLKRIGGCLTLDGALFEYTMANFEPFNTAPELRGVLYHTDEEVYNLISKAHENNLQCSLHAVGERAIDQLIYTYYRVIKEQGAKDLRHRIEHFCLPTEQQIAMAKELNLVLSMQPGFTYLWDKEIGGEFAQILGRERANRWDPFNKIVDRNIVVCGGSDSPVTNIEPLVDIATCVCGDNPVRNISVTDAIRMYTANAAYAVGDEENSGTIEIGKRANLTVIDKNPYECFDEEELYGIAPIAVVVGGVIELFN